MSAVVSRENDGLRPLMVYGHQIQELDRILIGGKHRMVIHASTVDTYEGKRIITFADDAFILMADPSEQLYVLRHRDA